MTETQFQEIMMSKYSFDIHKNDLFYKSFIAAMDGAKNTTINSLSMAEYYEKEEYEQEFILKYVSKLKLLVSSTKMINPGMDFTIHGINLNELISALPDVEDNVTKLEEKIMSSK